MTYRVVSIRDNPAIGGTIYVYDYCGCIGQALKRIAERESTKLYHSCFAQRMRVTKGRQRGSRRWLLASNPIYARGSK